MRAESDVVYARGRERGILLDQRSYSQLMTDIVTEVKEPAYLDLSIKARDALINDLSTEHGLRASIDIRYNHFFGRDLETVALDINAMRDIKVTDPALFQAIKSSVLGFLDFQLPTGQFPHEVKLLDINDQAYRKGWFPHLKKIDDEWWMCNPDSVDATILGLIATPQFLEGEEEWSKYLPHMEKALNWLQTLINSEKHHGFAGFDPDQRAPDAHIENKVWTDSPQAYIRSDGTKPKGSIAAVEVQAYTWKALKVWADIYEQRGDKEKAQKLHAQADLFKAKFQESFAVLKSGQFDHLAHAVINGQEILDIPSVNMGFFLDFGHDGEFVLDQEAAITQAEFIMKNADMFDKKYGVQIFAPEANKFGDNYHRGKIPTDRVYWPVATGRIGCGLVELALVLKEENNPKWREIMTWGKEVLETNQRVIENYGFIEQFYVHEGEDGQEKVERFVDEVGQSCNDQAWTMSQQLRGNKFLEIATLELAL